MTSADWELLRNVQISVLNTVNLSSVTAATDGDSVDVRLANSIRVYIEVTGNTGAVTVTIEASPTGNFTGEEVELDAVTYTATNTTGIFQYNAKDYLRVTTTTQSNSTVSGIITGRT